ncbi:transcriptional Coactivator p15-domain-containing protein [Dichomitus squalens]|uniref:Transcriptional Coactivator p15-domain-containing protein n=1 Tax=Dichomitus squalens TaxID=114155 RepID=A0A4Q9MHU3_9APHY|nr:transcriptional Coactivator p15-domain-containing protein [Dichomitus squalens]
MVKRKAAAFSSDEEGDAPRAAASSPERPLQTARRSGKNAKHEDDSEEGEEEEEVDPKRARKSKAKAKPEAKAKASKAAKPPAIKKPRIPTPDEEEDVDTSVFKVGVNSEGERYVDLGKKRRATVRQFKGVSFLDIREFYGDDNDLKPGKKGISLSQEQWETLKKSSDVVDTFFARLKK